MDECFIDFTGYVKEEILRMFPEFAKPPTESSLGLDTPLPPPPSLPLTEGGAVIPINYIPEKPKEEPKEDTGKEESAESKEQTSGDKSESIPEVATAQNGEQVKDATPNDSEDFLHESSSESMPEASTNPVVEDDCMTKTWHDVALYISSKLMQRCRDLVKHELGYPNSAVS